MFHVRVSLSRDGDYWNDWTVTDGDYDAKQDANARVGRLGDQWNYDDKTITHAPDTDPTLQTNTITYTLDGHIWEANVYIAQCDEGDDGFCEYCY